MNVLEGGRGGGMEGAAGKWCGLGRIKGNGAIRG